MFAIIWPFSVTELVNTALQVVCVSKDLLPRKFVIFNGLLFKGVCVIVYFPLRLLKPSLYFPLTSMETKSRW